MSSKTRIAEIHYSPRHERLEVSLPPGAKFADFPSLAKELFNESILERLKVPCASCHSGIPIVIREQYENEVRVDLDSHRVVDRPL